MIRQLLTLASPFTRLIRLALKVVTKHRFTLSDTSENSFTQCKESGSC